MLLLRVGDFERLENNSVTEPTVDALSDPLSALAIDEFFGTSSPPKPEQHEHLDDSSLSSTLSESQLDSLSSSSLIFSVDSPDSVRMKVPVNSLSDTAIASRATLQREKDASNLLRKGLGGMMQGLKGIKRVSKDATARVQQKGRDLLDIRDDDSVDSVSVKSSLSSDEEDGSLALLQVLMCCKCMPLLLVH